MPPKSQWFETLQNTRHLVEENQKMGELLDNIWEKLLDIENRLLHLEMNGQRSTGHSSSSPAPVESKMEV